MSTNEEKGSGFVEGLLKFREAYAADLADGPPAAKRAPSRPPSFCPVCAKPLPMELVSSGTQMGDEDSTDFCVTVRTPIWAGTCEACGWCGTVETNLDHCVPPQSKPDPDTLPSATG